MKATERKAALERALAYTEAITAEYRRVLTILAGCPDGATAYALHHLQDVSADTIWRLEERKFITAEVQQTAARNASGEPIPVVRLRITAAGVEQIHPLKKGRKG